MKLFDDPQEELLRWKVRESGLGATAFVPGEKNTHPGWEDAAVAPDKVGDYLRDFKKLLDRYDYKAALYGHFGDGCIHCRIDFDIGSTDGVRKRSEEHTSELQSLMRISYAVFCLKKKKKPLYYTIV